MARSAKPSVADVTIDPKYKKYDSFVGVCIAQLLFGLIGATIGGYMLYAECIDQFNQKIPNCQGNHRQDSIAAIIINGLVSIISLMGIVVAASELPLMRRQTTLLDVMKMDEYYERAKRLQTAHVWISLFMSIANYIIVFYYLNRLLFAVKDGKLDTEETFFVTFVILLVFYFFEFTLFMVTAVAQKAIIVSTFDKGIKAITAEAAEEEKAVFENERSDEIIKTNGTSI